MISTTFIKKIAPVFSSSAIKLNAAWRPLWSALTSSSIDAVILPRKDLSVSVERSRISVVYGVKLFSRIMFKGVRQYPVHVQEYPEPEELASSVALAINDLGASKEDVTLIIPKAWAIVRTAEFPATVKENIDSAVSFDLDRLTPFNPEDAYYDYRIIKEGANRITVLVVVSNADLIRKYLESLAAKEIKVKRVTIDLTGMGALSGTMAKGRESNGLFVEVEGNEYKCALFADGLLSEAFSGTLSEEDDALRAGTVIEGLKPFKDALKQQGITPRMTLSLKGVSSTFKEILTMRAGLPVTVLGDTDPGVRIPGSQKEMPYTAIGGVLESLRSEAEALNLLSKGAKVKPATPMTLTAALLIILVFLGGIYTIAPLKIEEKRLEKISQQVADRKNEIKKVEALRKELEALKSELSSIDNFKADRPLSLNMLKELTNILPKKSWLSRVKITESTVEIEGYAESATELLPKLEASKYFKKTEFSSPTFRDVRLNMVRFVIKMEIEGITKKEGEKPKDGKK